MKFFVLLASSALHYVSGVEQFISSYIIRNRDLFDLCLAAFLGRKGSRN